MSFNFNLLTLNIKLTAGPLRKVTIPDFYRFSHLHDLIMWLFEFDDQHLHKFEVKPKEIDDSDPASDDLEADNPLFRLMAKMREREYIWISNPDSFLRTGDVEEKNEAHVSLSFGFQQEGDSVNYEYDFGDSWRVKIDLINKETKTVNPSEYVPCIEIVGGRGKTVPEYGRSGGTKYNKKQLNESIVNQPFYTFYSSEFIEEMKEQENENEDDNHNGDDNQDSKKKRKSSILGKRRQRSSDNDDDDDDDYIQRKKQKN